MDENRPVVRVSTSKHFNSINMIFTAVAKSAEADLRQIAALRD
jgi:hypothetical protein